jgi:hypothetical protein
VIRLYIYMAEQLLMALSYLQTDGITFRRSIRPWADRYMRNCESPALRNIFQNHFSQGPSQEMPEDVDDLIKVLTDLIIHARKPLNNEGDLIEQMVRILGLPYARNAISGRTLTQLRNALMLPGELGAGAALQTQELACTACNHTFVLGEMTTIHQGENRNIGLMCTGCLPPTSARCRNCAESVPLNQRKVHTLLSKGISCQCQLKKGSPVAVQGNPLDDILTNIDGGVVTIGVPPNEVPRGYGRRPLTPNDVPAAYPRIQNVRERDAEAMLDAATAAEFAVFENDGVEDV